ncbi:hypothetical protein BSL78_13083 [Apostichopus japonicus]|uniref:Uncharacterized protein n=1 Tax=Stichopus japonicus TaxID=307972 RepID=A0A2G8KPY4_STIJA|nr:hypothetical protein BSL78_13083 [Apostichopus japonicus]
MPNIASIIKGHNKRIAATHTSKEKEACNCRKKDTCPLNGNCQASNIIYKAEVKTIDNCKTYIGLTEPPFKLRYGNHKMSLNHEKHQNATELSKHIWQLKQNNQPFSINWSIASRAKAYSTSRSGATSVSLKNSSLSTQTNGPPEQTPRAHIEVSPRKQVLHKQLQSNHQTPSREPHTTKERAPKEGKKPQQQIGRKENTPTAEHRRKSYKPTNRTDAKENTQAEQYTNNRIIPGNPTRILYIHGIT